MPCRILCVLLSLVSSAQAAIELPSMFANSMVIQRDKPVKVWGWASPDSSVTVRIADQLQTTTADADGKWSVHLKALPAGGPHTLQISGDNSSHTISDVLVGEVWLCSGQSNMAMTVNRAKDFDQEAAAATFPQIRMFKVDSGHAQEPQDRCRGSWSVCSPETVGGFSATAYFFGRRLHQELNVPIGLINSSVGGTSIESWTSMPAQKAVAAIEPRLAAWEKDDADFDADKAAATFNRATELWKKRAAEAKAAGKQAPRKPSLAVQPRTDRNYPANLFNGKINPLIGYTIRGAIWYQGENAAGRGFSHLYGDQLKTLIADWRIRWNQGDFPFAWVQLPNYRTPQTEPSETTGWVLVQEGMLKTLNVPNTGMAVTIDVGEQNDIHPKDKQSVGHRLAQWALQGVYDRPLIPMGPIFRQSTIRGRDVMIDFDHADGLRSATDEVKGFAIAGADRKFVWANARIDGEQVIVSSPDVPEPRSVRYAWAANPVFSLYNKANIPASPFRTDNWTDQGLRPTP
ncbi:MAG: sialate O-acetylesterase [Planctomycetaceae bacterium]|nr:sialate O-acetylesterase [Planctomycetaceae bacterium]